MMKFVPNLLSISRLLSSFFLIPFVLKDDFFWAIVILIIASISDFLDGYLARKLHVSSDLGAMLDPLADKVLMTVSYIIFAYKKLIPVYTTVIVVGRDIIILFVVFICKLSNIDLKICPILSSKINTAIQLIFVMIVLSCNYSSINVSYTIELCAVVVCISTLFSGAEYVQKYYWIKDRFFER